MQKTNGDYKLNKQMLDLFQHNLVVIKYIYLPEGVYCIRDLAKIRNKFLLCIGTARSFGVQ